MSGWPAGSPEARWCGALDDLEIVLDRQRAALERGDHTDPAAARELVFTPPGDLPPVPPALESRARRLLAATRALAERAQTVAERLSPVSRHAAHQTSGRRPAARFDRRM